MKTSDLIDRVASEATLEKGATKKAVEAVFAAIVDAAKKGEEANFPGFGMSCCRFGGHLVKVFTGSEIRDEASIIQP